MDNKTVVYITLDLKERGFTNLQIVDIIINNKVEGLNEEQVMILLDLGFFVRKNKKTNGTLYILEYLPIPQD